MDTITTAAKVSGGWSDFFGSVKGVAEDYLYKVGNEILPNWTNQQLMEQSSDLLKNDTYNPSAAQPRVEDISTKEGGLFDYKPNYQSPVTQDNVGKVLAIGVMLIVGVVAAKGLMK